MISKLKERWFEIGATTGAVIIGFAPKALAEGVANTQVTGAFLQLKDDILATMGVVLPYGIGIMTLFMAWKYGRKIFNTVGK